MSRRKKEKPVVSKSKRIPIRDRELDYLILLLDDALELETHTQSRVIYGGGGMSGMMGASHYTSSMSITAKSPYNTIIQKAIIELKKEQQRRIEIKEKYKNGFIPEGGIIDIQLKSNPPIF